MDGIENQNNTIEQTNTNETPVAQAPVAPKKRPAGLIATIIIAVLALGAAGTFGIIKLIESNQPEPPAPSEPTTPPDLGDTSTTDYINYNFLRLENNSENIIYSPESIANGLALLEKGADGTTKSELDNVIGALSIKPYQNIENKLSFANAVFIKDDFKDSVSPQYTSAVQNDLGSEIVYDSFSDTANLDNWTKQKTFNLIDSAGVKIEPDLKMVLINALALQMKWKNEFDFDNTSGKPFYKADGSEITATTMNKETTNSNFKYYSDDSVKAVSIPLDTTSNNLDLDFIAVMPSESLSDYIKNMKIGSSAVEDTIKKLKPASEPKNGIAISIPKFKFEYKLNFKEDLMAMGIKSAFSQKEADFSKMASAELYVSQASHKANIDFSEEGIKAAAVTTFGMDTKAAMDEPEPVDVTFDRPFLFVIRDKSNGINWFVGAVYEPNLWSDDESAYTPSYR